MPMTNKCSSIEIIYKAKEICIYKKIEQIRFVIYILISKILFQTYINVNFLFLLFHISFLIFCEFSRTSYKQNQLD